MSSSVWRGHWGQGGLYERWKGMFRSQEAGTAEMKVDTVRAWGLQQAPEQAHWGSTRLGAQRPPQDGCCLTTV